MLNHSIYDDVCRVLNIDLISQLTRNDYQMKWPNFLFKNKTKENAPIIISVTIFIHQFHLLRDI